MAEVWVGERELQIVLSVPERVLSLHDADVAVALDVITDVRVVRDVVSHVRGVRRPGAAVPGVMAIGVWRGKVDRSASREFHDLVVITDPGPGVVISTRGDFDRLVVSTDEPERLALELGSRLTASCGRPPT